MRLLTRLELHELKDRRQKEGDRHRGQEVDHRQGLRHGSCEVWLLLHLEDDDAVLGRRHAPVFWVDKHCEGGETQKRNFVGIRRWLVVLSWKGWLPYPLTNQKLVLKQVKKDSRLFFFNWRILGGFGRIITPFSAHGMHLFPWSKLHMLHRRAFYGESAPLFC